MSRHRAWWLVFFAAVALILWLLPLEVGVVLLIALPLVDWAAVLATHAVLRHYPQLRALRERRDLAVAIAGLSTLFAVLALSRLGHIELPGEAVGKALILAIAGLSAINGLFLWQYRHALFGRAAEVPLEHLQDHTHEEDEAP